jgi:hypothetical protein
MKVLCLYNHPEYGAPMVRSAPYFEAHGMEMTVKQTGQNESDVLLALARLPGPYDVVLLQEPPVTDVILETVSCVPTILLERVDGAQLRASRDYLPRVAGVIKSYAFRDCQQYNEEYDRAHIRILHEAGIECRRPLHQERWNNPELSAEDLAKIRIGYSGFGCHDILKWCVEQEVDLDAPRPIDVHFAGTVAYQGTEVEAHRRLAIKAAADWCGPSVASAGRGIPRAQYYDQILQSKAVLCPWGWGEATYRDYEAMALGAVVIKPDTSHVESWPDIYDDMSELYVPCKPDFSDVHDIVSDIVERWGWGEYQEMREWARRVIVDAWQPESIAERMAALIKELVG